MSLMERLERQKNTNAPAVGAPAAGRSAERHISAASHPEEHSDLKQQIHADADQCREILKTYEDMF